MQGILENLIVHEERIKQNVNRAASLIATEALMFRLAEKMGKQDAHQFLYEISMQARSASRQDSDKPLIELLAAHPDINSLFTQNDLQKAIDPSHHIGLAGQLTDRVLKNAADWLKSHRNPSTELSTCPLQDTDICK